MSYPCSLNRVADGGTGLERACSRLSFTAAILFLKQHGTGDELLDQQQYLAVLDRSQLRYPQVR